MKAALAAVLLLCCSHVSSSHKVKRNADLSQLSVPVRLPPVPRVKNAGADGLPELPKVENLATMFVKEESSVNSEAKTFISRLRAIQKGETTKLAQLKSAYDQKLKSQEKANQALVKTNSGLARQVMAQNKANEQIKAQLKRLDMRITARRQQLQALEQRFLDGRQFMKSALSTTDDSKEMSLIEVKTGPKAQNSFLELSSETREHEEPEAEQEQQVMKEPEVSAEQQPEVQEAQGTEAKEQQQEAKETETAEDTPMSFLELGSESQIVHKKSLRHQKRKTNHHALPPVVKQAQVEAAAAEVETETSDPSNVIQTLTQTTEPEIADPEAAVAVPQAQEAVPETEAVAPAAAEKAKADDDGTEDAALVNMVRESLSKLREGSKKGQVAMKAKFQSSYRDGVARHKALQEQQKVLQSSLKALTAKAKQLQQAEAALKKKLAGLEKTLVKGGAFLNGLSKMANARVEEVPQTIKSEVVTPVGTNEA